MFVRLENRGQRIAAQILTELEAWASESGFTACVLETGFKQPEAIALYRRSGYEVIPNYGQYSDVGNSVCMRKEIS
jgi:GNAT superfamily N-acetyltransferase